MNYALPTMAQAYLPEHVLRCARYMYNVLEPDAAVDAQDGVIDAHDAPGANP